MSYQVTNARINFKCIVLSEKSQSEKAIPYVIPIFWHSGKDKTIEIEKKISDFQGLREKGGRVK